MKKFIFSKFAGLYLATLPTNQLLDKYFQHHFILSHSPLCIDSIPPSQFEDPPPPFTFSTPVRNPVSDVDIPLCNLCVHFVSQSFDIYV